MHAMQKIIQHNLTASFEWNGENKTFGIQLTLECFFHNYYAGFRNETISFDPCANGKCSFHKERYAKPGCVVENKWKPCNLDECERGNLTCTFVDNTCGWKPWKNGLKWSRKINKNTGLLALGGVNISSDVYAWIVVVVLPINSALNPFIYTLSIMNKNKVLWNKC
uniref:G-protein coupled receptors family 1 profile domain-containing protein n=1 Tax=Magallana gigas TaxID=29159 RepID=K1PPZ1_MAGGI